MLMKIFWSIDIYLALVCLFKVVFVFGFAIFRSLLGHENLKICLRMKSCR